MTPLQIVLVSVSVSVSVSVLITVIIGVFAMRSMTGIFNQKYTDITERYMELLRIVLLVKTTMMEALIRDTQLFDNLLEDWTDEIPAVVPDEGEPDVPEQTDSE